MGIYRINKPYVPDYVEHHGILGMHWGDRNGPPYPLSGSEHSAVTKRGKKERAASSDRGSIRAAKKKAKAIKKANKRKAKDYTKRLNELDKTIASADAQAAGLQDRLTNVNRAAYKNASKSWKYDTGSKKYNKYQTRAKKYLQQSKALNQEVGRLGKRHSQAVKETNRLLNEINKSKNFDWRVKGTTRVNSVKSTGAKNAYANGATYYQTVTGNKYKVASKGKNKRWDKKKQTRGHVATHTAVYYV